MYVGEEDSRMKKKLFLRVGGGAGGSTDDDDIPQSERTWFTEVSPLLVGRKVGRWEGG